MRRIEDYAVIGDSHAAALVHRDGSMDWLCLPRFDSPACFAALLGSADNGRWRIAPRDQGARTSRRYRADTLILDTEFETAEGRARLTDFMPAGGVGPQVVRKVTGIAGRVAMRMELVIRFDYGRLVPWVSRDDDGALVAVAGPHLLALRAEIPLRGQDLKTVADFEISAGDETTFVLSYGTSYGARPAPRDAAEALASTEDHWRRWAARCSYVGPWREAVVRSAITLKAMTYAPTGGIVAALTTSLPERIGGQRNWDYRFCWLRDATFTLLSLMIAGYRDEAEEWRRWLIRAVAGKASQVQPLYTVLGENRVDEWEVPWLDGFADSRPVRIGNAAFGQMQLDVFGEILDALHQGRRNQLAPSEASWALQQGLLAHLESVVDQPDRGIWEVRIGDKHFTHSKVMSWVAFDRAVAAIERFGLDGPVDGWRSKRDALHHEICSNAFDPELGSFVQAYGSKELDASSLLIPLVGFLPPEDARVVGTIRAIERHLVIDGLVMRYDSATAPDGFPPGEGRFLPCSFWLADNFALQGRRQDARALFERLLSLRNDVGLLAEEYDPRSRRQLGNFPQALSHLALIGTAYNLLDRGPSRERRL